jgi:hypothetical protein
MTRIAAAPVNTFTPRRSATSSSQNRHCGFGPHLAIQRDGAGPTSPGAPGLIRNVVASPGEPLDVRLRSIMEPQLGYDFSNVRVHTDTPAAQSADAIGANAYTAGEHIVFGAGRFNPNSPRGQRLVAHELAHVIQQATGPIGGHALDGDVSMSTPDDSLERAAARLSDNAMQARNSAGAAHNPIAPLPERSNGPGPIAVQRQSQDTWSGPTGAIAGIIGAVAGLAALGIALWAWLRPKNPAPTTGGITLNSQPINAADPNGVPPDRQDAALSATTHTEKLLDLKTDDKNWADINFDVATDGVSIFSAIPQTVPHNYNGGTGGSSAVLNFAAPTPVAVPKYDTTPKSDVPKKTPPKGKGKESAPPPPPAPKDTPAVLQVAFNGTNSVGEKEPLQQFAGRFAIRANPGGHRMVECIECVPRNQVGFASTDNQKIGHVDYHGHAAPAQQNPPTPGPQQSQPNPPPPTGGK